MFNVVVDDENTGKQLLQNGDLQRRVTIIPLNKIQSNPVPPRIQHAATKLVGYLTMFFSQFVVILSLFTQIIIFFLLLPC